jgi:hypothetical protein
LLHPSARIARICYRLSLLPLVLALTLPGPFSLAPSRFPVGIAQIHCESHYSGITYCLEDRGRIHVVIIDLDDPHIRFEMVMADDATSVETTRRERIEDMVTRPPYVDQSVVVAINADYFGTDHGPEGLTIKNGHRLDADGGLDDNPHAVWRSSLAISRLNRVSLGRKTDQELAAPRVYRERFYNAIGGGPLILNYGIVIPNAISCLLERFPIGACRRRIQTAAGLSEDGRRLLLAVGEGRDIEGFARLLQDYGAFTAIKLDGGGSSQLWYDGRMRYDSDRAVGNALVVLHSTTPRHDARFTGPATVPVAEPGARVEIPFEIHNTGYLDWEPDLGYRFKNVQGWPVLGSAYERLPEAVPSGATLSHSLVLVAPRTPGVYESEWQLTRRAEPVGSRLWFPLIVIPPGLEALAEPIEAQLLRWQRLSNPAAEWPRLRDDLDRQIWQAAEVQIRQLAYDSIQGSRLPAEAYLPGWWPAQRPFAW